jgi:CRP-like cAMP-binding protein
METSTALRAASRPIDHVTGASAAPTARPPMVYLLERAFAVAALAPGAVDALAAVAREHRVRPDVAVFTRRDAASGLWLVVRGRVTVGGWEAGDHWRQTHAVQDGDWLDAFSAWLGGTFQEDAVAETDTSLLEFPVAAVRRVCAAHPSLARGFLGLLSLRIRQLTENTHGLLSKDVMARCADWLLASMDASGGPVRMNQRKRAIASQLGATPETFSRTLRQLREKGAIEVNGYSIVVRDTDVLRRLARG